MIDMLFAAGLALAQPPAADAPKAATAAETYAALVQTAARVPTPLPYDDSRDHARRMASSDQNHERFFNRPGATRADYDRQWTACRQIGRRLATHTSNGNIWATAFAQGGVVGGFVGGAIVNGFSTAFSQRRARQDIRRQCLIAAGYRLVLPDEAGRQRISAMSRDERTAWFDSTLGAEQLPVAGRVIDWDAMVAAGGIRDAMDDDED